MQNLCRRTRYYIFKSCVTNHQHAGMLPPSTLRSLNGNLCVLNCAVYIITQLSTQSRLNCSIFCFMVLYGNKNPLCIWMFIYLFFFISIWSDVIPENNICNKTCRLVLIPAIFLEGEGRWIPPLKWCMYTMLIPLSSVSISKDLPCKWNHG